MRNISVESSRNTFATTTSSALILDWNRIVSVHPMREEAVSYLLAKADDSWDIVDRLIEEDELIETAYNVNKYYMRKLPVS